MKTLLAIGDKKDFDTYIKFYRNRKYFKKNNFIFKTVDYNAALKEEFPRIDTNKVIVFLFFPFDYWDSHIEKKTDKAVYGNKSYYDKFKKFWKMFEGIIRSYYADKDIYYINSPNRLAVDRDKKLTKKILSRAGIRVPFSYASGDYKKIISLLNKGKELFIKVRFGSMGKGITYLEKNRWMTNFGFRNQKIISRKSDYGWKFHNITGRSSFLKKILKEDVIIEQAIDPLLLKRRKFDLRLYVCFHRVIYIYPRSTHYSEITTNISQGAKGEPQRYLKTIPVKVLRAAGKAAVNSAKAMHLNFCGVDIMPDADGKNVTVIEVNAFPGLPRSKSYNLSKDIINIITRQIWR